MVFLGWVLNNSSGFKPGTVNLVQLDQLDWIFDRTWHGGVAVNPCSSTYYCSFFCQTPTSDIGSCFIKFVHVLYDQHCITFSIFLHLSAEDECGREVVLEMGKKRIFDWPQLTFSLGGS